MLSVIYRDQLADVKMTDAFNRRVYNLGYRLAHLVDMVDVTYLHTICEICDNSGRIYCSKYTPYNFRVSTLRQLYVSIPEITLAS